MLIPIRCVTCGNMLASKYKRFLEYKKNYRNNCKRLNKEPESDILSFNKTNDDVYNLQMEKVGLKRYCCKRHFIGQQEIIYKI